jgi:hypothetical protein
MADQPLFPIDTDEQHCDPATALRAGRQRLLTFRFIGNRPVRRGCGAQRAAGGSPRHLGQTLRLLLRDARATAVIPQPCGSRSLERRCSRLRFDSALVRRVPAGCRLLNFPDRCRIQRAPSRSILVAEVWCGGLPEPVASWTKSP